MSDIVDRLRRWAISPTAVPASDLMDEAAVEIERLRHRVRFADAVIRSGSVATLTAPEREALQAAIDIEQCRGATSWATALRGLLERLSPPAT